MRDGGQTSPIWRAALFAFALLCGGREAHAQQDLEDAVKASFLFRFASFAAWPADAFTDPSAPLVICVVGDADMGRLVEQTAAGQRVAGRQVTVRTTATGATYAGCHILYVALAPEGVRQTLNGAGQGVLTVTDGRYGSDRGAIHFVRSGGRVRFHINRHAAERNGVSLNARLLNIALTVNGAPR